MAFPFQDTIVTIAALAGVLFASYVHFTGKMKRDREEYDRALYGRMDEKTGQIINAFEEKMKVVQNKFDAVDSSTIKNEDDIKDVEKEMKDMVAQFREMCDKLSKHQFILDDVLPDFKSLRKEFFNFKNKVDIHMYGNNSLVNTKDVERNTSHDTGEDGLK